MKQSKIVRKREIALWLGSWISKRKSSLFREMRERGFDISAICKTAVDKQRVSDEQKGIVNEVISISEVIDKFWIERSRMNIEDIVETAKQNEERYNVQLIDLIKADRHMGRGFIKGGWFPRSLMSETLHYYEYLDIANRMLAFFESFFSRHVFSVLLIEVASLPTKAACVVARLRGIAIRVPHPSRIDDLYFFGNNEFMEAPSIEAIYYRILKNAKTTELRDPKTEEKESYGLARSEIGKYLEYRSRRVLIKNVCSQVMVQLYRKVIRYSVYSPYYVRDRIKAMWLYHRWIKKFERRAFPKPDRYVDRRYIFYPLQLEPESAMMVMSPEFSHQDYLIHILASTLPAGWNLVVKEHPLALGTRPSGFYERIEAYPNVVLVCPFDSARGWYLKSQAVGMITGSVGYEAAMEGIPVISFGQHNFIRVLEHVFVVNSYESIRDAISYIEKGRTNSENIRKIQGMALREAVIEGSFSYNSGSHDDERGNAGERKMAVFVDRLLETLEIN